MWKSNQKVVIKSENSKWLAVFLMPAASCQLQRREKDNSNSWKATKTFTIIKQIRKQINPPNGSLVRFARKVSSNEKQHGRKVLWQVWPSGQNMLGGQSWRSTGHCRLHCLGCSDHNGQEDLLSLLSSILQWHPHDVFAQKWVGTLLHPSSRQLRSGEVVVLARQKEHVANADHATHWTLYAKRTSTAEGKAPLGRTRSAMEQATRAALHATCYESGSSRDMWLIWARIISACFFFKLPCTLEARSSKTSLVDQLCDHPLRAAFLTMAASHASMKRNNQEQRRMANSERACRQSTAWQNGDQFSRPLTELSTWCQAQDCESGSWNDVRS